MPVRIRLKRMGRKKAPHYRIVVADSASPRDGRFVETLGYYKPTESPARVVVDLEKVDHWVENGALLSDTVASLVRKARAGGDDKVAFGEPDPEEVKAQKAAALAERRRAEAAAREEAAKAGIAAAAAAEAAAEADAAEEAEAAAEAEAEAEGDDIPVVEAATETEEAPAEEAPAAEADAAPEAEASDEAAEEESADEEE